MADVVPCVWPSPSPAKCEAYQDTASRCRGCRRDGTRELKCCCQFGTAVGGEPPEFRCPDCEVHTEDLLTHKRCKRHAHINGDTG